MVEPNPEKRANIKDIMESEWFRDKNIASLEELQKSFEDRLVILAKRTQQQLLQQQ
jgi:hypothetical protein